MITFNKCLGVIKGFKSESKFQILIFLFLSFELILRAPKPYYIDSWCATPYLMTYEFGFNSRFLIGSLVDLLTPFLSEAQLYIFIFASLLFLNAMVAFTLGEVIKRSEDIYKNCIYILIIIYLASPASISFLFGRYTFGRLDTYLIILCFLSITIIRHSKLQWFLPTICFLCVATHQIFIFTYFPIVVGLQIYEIHRQNYKKSSIACILVTIVISSFSFLYFQLSTPPLSYPNAEAFFNALSIKSNIPICLEMIDFEYYKTMADHWHLLIVPSALSRIVTGITVVILSSPLIFIIGYLWKTTLENCEDKRLKLVFRFMMWSPIIALPAFVLSIDWGRWFAAVFIVQFFYIFYLTYRGCLPTLMALQCLQKYFDANKIKCVILIYYLCVLGKFGAAEQLELAHRIIYMLKTILLVL